MIMVGGTVTENELDHVRRVEDVIRLGRVEALGHSINLHLTVHLNGHRGEVNMLRGMMGFAPVLANQGG